MQWWNRLGSEILTYYVLGRLGSSPGQLWVGSLDMAMVDIGIEIKNP
jgi:hypothetical protein